MTNTLNKVYRFTGQDYPVLQRYGVKRWMNSYSWFCCLHSPQFHGESPGHQSEIRGPRVTLKGSRVNVQGSRVSLQDSLVSLHVSRVEPRRLLCEPSWLPGTYMGPEWVSMTLGSAWKFLWWAFKAPGEHARLHGEPPRIQDEPPWPQEEHERLQYEHSRLQGWASKAQERALRPECESPRP